jgi:hypothetical protein
VSGASGPESHLRGTALTETQIKNLQITQPNGPAILALEVSRLFRTADR